MYCLSQVQLHLSAAISILNLTIRPALLWSQPCAREDGRANISITCSALEVGRDSPPINRYKFEMDDEAFSVLESHISPNVFECHEQG